MRVVAQRKVLGWSKMIEILAEFKTIMDMHNSSGSWSKVPLVLLRKEEKLGN